jgi:hypothetical protein
MMCTVVDNILELQNLAASTPLPPAFAHMKGHHRDYDFYSPNRIGQVCRLGSQRLRG